MKRVYFIVLISLVFLSCKKEISEFQEHNFIKLFGSGITSNGLSVEELADGYIFSGFDNTTDFGNQVFVIRTNKAGNVIWQKQYGTALNDKGIAVRGFDNNFFIAVNSTNSATNITSSFVLKLNSNGEEVASFNIANVSYSLIVNDIIIDSEAIYVAGESYEESPTQPDYFIAKLSHQGEVLWNNTYKATGNQRFYRIFKSQSNNLILVGTNSVVVGSSFSHITVVEIGPTQGIPTRNITLPAQTNHFFGDAFVQNNDLLIVFNQLNGSTYSASVLNYNLTTLSALWSNSNETPFLAKGITKSANGIITVCGEKDDNIHVNQFNDSGTIIRTSSNLKLPTGSVEQIIATKDNGFTLIGTTAPDYGTMMQAIKSDADLFLFNQ